jgi:hypothetical protein
MAVYQTRLVRQHGCILCHFVCYEAIVWNLHTGSLKAVSSVIIWSCIVCFDGSFSQNRFLVAKK